MNPKDYDLSIFTQLGMTGRQAEIYIAISKLGQAAVKTIAKTAQTDRAEIYRVMPKLQKLGLIKKIVTTPITLRAIPLSEGLSILLQRNSEKHKEIQTKAEQFLRSFKEKKTNQKDFQYTLTSGLKGVDREFLRNLGEIQTRLDCIFQWRGILYRVNRQFEDYKEALERGIKIRYITHVPEGEKMPQTIQTLKKTGFFEIRNAATAPKAGIAINDKKSISIVTLSGSNTNELEVLHSNNPAVAGLAQDYFELKWAVSNNIK